MAKKARELGYETPVESEIKIKKTENDYWLLMPEVLHKMFVVYEDSVPMDQERATMPFIHLQPVTNIQSLVVDWRRKMPQVIPDSYEIVMLEWDLCAVIAPDGQIAWGQKAFEALLTGLAMETEIQNVSGPMVRKANSKLSLSMLSEEVGA